MTRESIIEQVNAILAEEFEIDQDLFTPNANVKETLSLDSLSPVSYTHLPCVTTDVESPYLLNGVSNENVGILF